jgi:hypothetical protein
MRAELELLVNSCDYIEECILHQRVSTIYEVIHHTSNVKLAIRSIESADLDHLRIISRSFGAIIEGRIIPVLLLLSQSDISARFSRLASAMNKFIGVYFDRIPTDEGSCDSIIIQYAFSISRSHSAVNRIFGIELATAVFKKISNPLLLGSEVQRFLSDWRKGEKQIDVGTRIAQLGLVRSILENCECLPYLKSSSVAEIQKFLLHQLGPIGVSENPRIRMRAKSVYLEFMCCFPDMKGPDPSGLIDTY